MSTNIMMGVSRCRIKSGWHGAGREGLFFLTIADEPLGQPWAVVLWDGEEDPDCFKAAGLEIVRAGGNGQGFSESEKRALASITEAVATPGTASADFGNCVNCSHRIYRTGRQWYHQSSGGVSCALPPPPQLRER